MKKTYMELTEQFVKEEKDVMELCMKQFDVVDLARSDFDEIKVFIKCMKMIDLANELFVEQARLLVDMDEQLNRISNVLKVEPKKEA